MRRIFAGLTGTLLLVALACAGAGDGDQPAAAQVSATNFQVVSTNFSEIRPKKRIPNEHSCHGENLSPTLAWSGAPDGTQSYALVAENIDHHTGVWVHWVLYDIPAGATDLPQGVPTSTSVLPDGMTQGTNDKRQIGFYGPCPPPRLSSYQAESSWFKTETSVPHRHFFRLYALDAKLGLAPGATKAELTSAMEGHVLAEADTAGKFTPPLLLEEKGGGFLETAQTQTPDDGPSPTPVP